MHGGYCTYTKEYLSPFPLPRILNQEDTKPYEELVDKIIEKVKAKDENSKIEELLILIQEAALENLKKSG